MSEAVLDILHRIEKLPEEDRLVLEIHLALVAKAEWRREAEQARKEAGAQGLDQAAIDRVVEKARYER
jgi:uncharacterized membrane protein